MKLTATAFLMIASTCLASSYTFIMEGIPSSTPTLEFSFRHPIMDSEWIDVSSLSGTYEFRSTFGMCKALDLELCLPYVIMEEADSSRSVSMMGGITAKLETSRAFWEDHGWTGHFSVSFPTMSREYDTQWASHIGRITNYFRGYSEYSPKVLSFEAIYSSMNRLKMTNIFLGHEIGATLWIPTGDNPIPGDTEVMLDYGFAGAIESGRMSFSLELVGLLFITEGYDTFTNRFNHAAILGWRWLGGPVKPGICLQLNAGHHLDGFVDAVVGLDVELQL